MTKCQKICSRILGVDVVKTLAIFLVLTLHIGRCGVQVAEESLTIPFILLRAVVDGLSLCCINLFAMASGFVLFEHETSWRKLLPMWLQVVFVGLVMQAVMTFGLGCETAGKDWIRVIMPVTRCAYWYFSAYVVVYLLSPVLNLAIKELRQEQFSNILLSLLVVLSLPACLMQDNECGYGIVIRHGSSALGLIVMWLLGAYLKKYILSSTKIRWGLILVVALFLRAVICVISGMSGHAISSVSRRILMGGSMSPLVIVMSTALFMLCLRVHVKNAVVCKVFAWTSSVSFGVYLIHVHPYFWLHVWIPTWHTVTCSAIYNYLLIVIGGAVVLYLICGILEWSRKKLFNFARVLFHIHRQ